MESRSDKYILPLVAALGALSPACGGSAESYNCETQVVVDAGADVKPESDSAADTAVEAEADANSEFSTRGQVVRDMVFDVMGYGGECTDPVFPDVPPTGELCRALEVMHDLGYVAGSPDGNFRPDDYVNRAELSKLISTTMGYVAYNAPCLSYFKDVDGNSWYSAYMGALCENGYQLTDGNGNARPGDAVTVEEWQEYKDAMNAKLVGLVTRGELARVLVEIVADGGDSPWTCKSEYSDVADETSLCASVSAADKYGIMTGYKDGQGNPTGEFGPNDTLTYGQLAKADVSATGVTIFQQPTGCSGVDASKWYANYMDALCEVGLADSTWGPKAQDNAARKDTYKLAWDSRIWKNKNQADAGK